MLGHTLANAAKQNTAPDIEIHLLNKFKTLHEIAPPYCMIAYCQKNDGLSCLQGKLSNPLSWY